MQSRRKETEEFESSYPVGTRVRLQFLDAHGAETSDLTGTVSSIGDDGEIAVTWDDGRIMRLVPKAGAGGYSVEEGQKEGSSEE
ncbi:MAG: DUF4314 domain-containing protein [Desulfovibrio sp.]|nr:DUF4314 domain-containing protein [Desulfovibrio sp.]